MLKALVIYERPSPVKQFYDFFDVLQMPCLYCNFCFEIESLGMCICLVTSLNIKPLLGFLSIETNKEILSCLLQSLIS